VETFEILVLRKRDVRQNFRVVRQLPIFQIFKSRQTQNANSRNIAKMPKFLK